jgi:hypothetical protein
VKLTARIAATSRRPGARDTVVGAAVMPAVAGDSEGSGAPSRRLLPLMLLTAVLLAAFAFGATSALAAPVLTFEPEPEYTSAKVKFGVDDPGTLAYGISIAINPETEGWIQGPEFFQHTIPPGHNTISEEFTGLKPDTTYKVKLETYDEAAEELFESQPPYSTFITKHVNSPVPTLALVSAVTTTTAHFAGTVNANAPAGSLTANQEEAYETSWHFECEPECGGAPSGVVKAGEAGFRGSEAGAPVEFDATRLETNTTYEVKLVATDGNGAHEVLAERTFSTPLVVPSVKPAPGASDGQSGYVVEGIVNPLGSSITDCHFEYGPTANYVFQAPCSPTPIGRTEVQELSYQNVDEGQFRLTFRGQETGDIDYGATAATVEAALKGLSTIGFNGIASVTASEPPGQTLTEGPYTVTFAGPLAETNLPKIGFKPGTDPFGKAQCCGNPRLPGSIITTTKTQGGNSNPIVVEAHLTGLTPGATYHVQLVATNGGGTSKSGDQIFVPTQEPAQPPCPNEEIRRENNSLALPECRAYEQVSSPFKAGYRANFFGFSEGNSVLWETNAGNVANSGQGLGLQNFYVANHTANGWETIPNLNRAGTLYAGPEALAPSSADTTPVPRFYSEDLQSSFWYVAPGRQYSDEGDSYLRGPDGRFTLIGTNAPPGDVAGIFIIGASSDLSHVVIGGNHTQSGLYEYVGTGNGAPVRMDLDNSGQPISECTGRPTGGGAYGGAEGKAVSTDGRTLIFVAVGGCGAAGPPADEIWARVDGTTSYDASESQCTRVDCNAPAPARFAGAARDGSSVFFTTTQQLVNSDTDESVDLYVYHLPTASDPNPSPALTEISGTGPGANTAEEGVSVSVAFSTAEGVTVSPDGSTAMFVSPAVLAGNEDAMEETAKPGEHNIYVWRRDASHPQGQVRFVGRVANDDIAGEFFIEGGIPGVHDPDMTPDGRFVVFNTASPLVPTDTDNGFDVYRYDTESGELTRVSTGPLGTGGNAEGFDAYLASRSRPTGFPDRPAEDPWPSQLSITDNGQAVVFSTSEGLVPRDGNGATDVYMWKNGRVSLISSGAAGNSVSEFGEFAIDRSGQDIYFVTAEALSPSDGDAVRDVYDARVGGGFSFAGKETCQGEACQPAGPAAPSSPSPATNQARAPESPAKATCPKGKVLKKGKCVKKPEKHKKHHKKHKGKRGNTKHGGDK